MGAEADQDSVFVSRVLDPGEVSENARPGITVFLREQVSFKDMAPIMAELEKLGIGAFTLQVDPRAKEEFRPEVMALGRPDRFNGIRVQFIPEFSSNREADLQTMQDAMIAAKEILLTKANVSYIGDYRYDTLVLEKGEYDPTGTIRGSAAKSRRDAWLGRARNAHDQAIGRRDEAKARIEQREEEARAIERESDLLEEQQLAEISSRIEKGPGVTAPQAQEYVGEEPTLDPNTGRPSLVRTLAQREADAGGAGFPKGSLASSRLRHLRSGAEPGGGRPPSVWQSLGGAFRAREKEVHRSFESTLGAISRLNPDQNKYEVSQRLFDYLMAPEKAIDDPEIESDVANLREQIPLLNREQITKHKQLQSGSEAQVYHDTEGGVVYKLFPVKEGRTGLYIPGHIRLRPGERRDIGLEMGPKPSFEQFLARVNNVNNHGKLTPMEFAGVTGEGEAVFVQPFVRGQRVKEGEQEEALKKLDMKLLTQLGGTAAIGRVGNKYVLFDDLHQDNLRKLPGGRIEAIDVINRDLTQDEVDDLRQLDKLPELGEVVAAQQQEVEPREGFYSGVAKILNRKMPDVLEALPARTVKGRVQPEREIRNPKTGELIKTIPPGQNRARNIRLRALPTNFRRS